jgi:hypothetical protein
VPQQGLITLLKGLPIAARRHRRGQRIGAMHLRHTAEFPKGILQPSAQTLEALRKADHARLPVRVGQHKVVNQVRKRLAANGDLQAAAMRKVRGTQPPRFMNLSEEHFFGRAVQGPPLFDPPLQGPHLTLGEAPRMLPLQPGEQGLGLQAAVERQLLFDLRPDLGKGVQSRSPGMFHAYLAGQLAESAILACGLLIDARFGGGLSLRPTLMIETAQPLDVQIGDHPKPPCRKGLRIGYRTQGLGKSNCR